MAVSKSDDFFNTTNEDQDHVKKRVKKCNSQKERVLELFRKHKKTQTHFTASQIWELYGGMTTPLTSIRRAMTQLTTAGILIKTNLKRDGLYNYPECFYKLKNIKDDAATQ